MLREFEAIAEWVPVCPEVELGMGVPRPAVHLHRGSAGTRLLEVESGRDHTAAMSAWAEARIRALSMLRLCGFVLKSGSPSCGLSSAQGLFASALVSALPELPVEEADRLSDPERRTEFIRRILERAP